MGIQWLSGTPKAHQRKQLILIDITSETPVTLQPGALAYAEAFGSHIRIFWDRVSNTGGSSLACELLGHVLAHEITHILVGTNHHSRTGVMKAHWTAHDIEQMRDKPLPFDPLDVELIHKSMLSQFGCEGIALRHQQTSLNRH